MDMLIKHARFDLCRDVVYELLRFLGYPLLCDVFSALIRGYWKVNKAVKGFW